MDDNKIIDLHDHTVNEDNSEKEETIDLANEALEQVIKFLKDKGYDITNPQFQLDFEVLHVLLQGTLLRQKRIDFHGIHLLNFIEHDDRNEPA